MLMAPPAHTRPAPSRLALRRAIGLPALALATVATLAWLALNALVAAVVLAGRCGAQALDYAGQVALGR